MGLAELRKPSEDQQKPLKRPKYTPEEFAALKDERNRSTSRWWQYFTEPYPVTSVTSAPVSDEDGKVIAPARGLGRPMNQTKTTVMKTACCVEVAPGQQCGHELVYNSSPSPLRTHLYGKHTAYMAKQEGPYLESLEEAASVG